MNEDMNEWEAHAYCWAEGLGQDSRHRDRLHSLPRCCWEEGSPPQVPRGQGSCRLLLSSADLRRSGLVSE